MAIIGGGCRSQGERRTLAKRGCYRLGGGGKPARVLRFQRPLSVGLAWTAADQAAHFTGGGDTCLTVMTGRRRPIRHRTSHHTARTSSPLHTTRKPITTPQATAPGAARLT